MSEHMGPTAKWWKRSPGTRLQLEPRLPCPRIRSTPHAAPLPSVSRAGYDLYRAVASGDAEGVSAILASSPEAAQWANDKGETCLHAACEYHVEGYTRHDALLPLLVGAGAQVDRCSGEGGGMTALMAACYYGHASCVEQLLKLGADANLEVCAHGLSLSLLSLFSLSPLSLC